ncbi:MAG TPA: hypothetical protein VKT53_03905 [Candidatus Acidoferrum sp.]|nr:hypothetical protein [Candidatus Acidoferrum sp.]
MTISMSTGAAAWLTPHADSVQLMAASVKTAAKRTALRKEFRICALIAEV